MKEVESSGFPLGHVLVESRVLELARALGCARGAGGADRAVGAALDERLAAARADGPAVAGRPGAGPQHQPAAPARDAPVPRRLSAWLARSAIPRAGCAEFVAALRLRAGGGLARRARAALALCVRSAALSELLGLPHPRPQLLRAVHALLWGADRGAAPSRHLPPPRRERPPPWATMPSPRRSPAARRSRARPRRPSGSRRFLERGNRERAVTVLRDAVDKHPSARALRRILALTQSRDGGFQAPVQRMMLDLLESDAGDNELRYALASYYRKARTTARALSAACASCCRPTRATRPPGATWPSSRRSRAAAKDRGVDQRRSASLGSAPMVVAPSTCTASRSAPSVLVPPGQGRVCL